MTQAMRRENGSEKVIRPKKDSPERLKKAEGLTEGAFSTDELEPTAIALLE